MKGFSFYASTLYMGYTFGVGGNRLGSVSLCLLCMDLWFTFWCCNEEGLLSVQLGPVCFEIECTDR